MLSTLSAQRGLSARGAHYLTTQLGPTAFGSACNGSRTGTSCTEVCAGACRALTAFLRGCAEHLAPGLFLAATDTARAAAGGCAADGAHGGHSAHSAPVATRASAPSHSGAAAAAVHAIREALDRGEQVTPGFQGRRVLLGVGWVLGYFGPSQRGAAAAAVHAIWEALDRGKQVNPLTHEHDGAMVAAASFVADALKRTELELGNPCSGCRSQCSRPRVRDRSPWGIRPFRFKAAALILLMGLVDSSVMPRIELLSTAAEMFEAYFKSSLVRYVLPLPFGFKLTLEASDPVFGLACAPAAGPQCGQAWQCLDIRRHPILKPLLCLYTLCRFPAKVPEGAMAQRGGRAVGVDLGPQTLKTLYALCHVLRRCLRAQRRTARRPLCWHSPLRSRGR